MDGEQGTIVCRGVTPVVTLAPSSDDIVLNYTHRYVTASLSLSLSLRPFMSVRLSVRLCGDGK